MLDHHTEEDRPATAAEAIREMAYSVAHPESALCGCKGSGWLLSDWDSWTPCPSHPGHPHPEADYDEDPIETLRVRYSNARETIKAYGKATRRYHSVLRGLSVPKELLYCPLNELLVWVVSKLRAMPERARNIPVSHHPASPHGVAISVCRGGPPAGDYGPGSSPVALPRSCIVGSRAVGSQGAAAADVPSRRAHVNSIPSCRFGSAQT